MIISLCSTKGVAVSACVVFICFCSFSFWRKHYDHFVASDTLIKSNLPTVYFSCAWDDWIFRGLNNMLWLIGTRTHFRPRWRTGGWENQLSKEKQSNSFKFKHCLCELCCLHCLLHSRFCRQVALIELCLLLPLWHSYQHTQLYLRPINGLLIRVLFALPFVGCVYARVRGRWWEGTSGRGGEQERVVSEKGDNEAQIYGGRLSEWAEQVKVGNTRISWCFFPLYNSATLVLSILMWWAVPCDSLCL